MASKTDPVSPAFDVPTVERLVELMAKHDLTEISLSEGGQRIRLRKGGAAPPAAPVMHYAPPQAAAPAGAAVSPPAPPARKLHEIKSPMVGTVYLKPKPDQDDYVKVGSALKPTTTVCTIEAMKIFNKIEAETTGTVAEVCVTNGQVVEFNTVLFRVEQA